MKILPILASLLILSGCATKDYSKIKISTASLSNLEVEEVGNLQQRKHEIKVSFDYAIENFSPENKLYTCSVLFANTDGTSVTSFRGTSHPCILNNTTGSVSITWPTPVDISRNAPKMVLSKLKYPIEYFVAIHQKTGKNSSELIGQSKPLTSKL
ncbi:hypothetical protein [Pseudoalteromonas piscicida]|uniref:hypothetical protein n=1 Tax=Pseudoalteromonas piscicida TaxID=43662 RepID=UPI001C960627|nr:hypothetical protein [Pseudoalteromonas piscicida]QZO14982.1 hypothetical protein K5642_22185 [Pseudoalteromonas piscicida]